MAETRGDRKLENIVPQQFGQWKKMEISNGIVNPQQEQLLNELYSDGDYPVLRVRGWLSNHAVDRLWQESERFIPGSPARDLLSSPRGFQVKSVSRLQLETPFGEIPVRQLETAYQSQRTEPVTYWTTIGDHATQSSVDKKFKEMEYAMQGLIADGLLFRVSSVDTNIPRAYEVQKQFISDILSAMSAKDRLRLAGLNR